MATNGDQWDHNVTKRTSRQLKSIHDLLWDEACKDDELGKKIS